MPRSLRLLAPLNRKVLRVLWSEGRPPMTSLGGNRPAARPVHGGPAAAPSEPMHQTALLLLLSRDLHSSRRDLHFALPKHNAREVTQMVLPGFDQPANASAGRHPARTCPRRKVARPDDALAHSYLSRLSAHGAAPRGVSAYQYQLRATVRAATRLGGGAITMAELFQDDALLGRALVHDESVQSSTLSKWTLAQRRSAVRSFAALMRPELLPLIKEEPTCVVDRALRLVAERVGGGYRLTGGAPRRRGGHAPELQQISAVN